MSQNIEFFDNAPFHLFCRFIGEGYGKNMLKSLGDLS